VPDSVHPLRAFAQVETQHTNPKQAIQTLT